MNQRQGEFEFLRIVCMILIISLHVVGPLNANLDTKNSLLSIFINSVGNIGVSCFVLISGYFSIKLRISKIIKLVLVTTFYSLVSLAIKIIFLEESMGLMEVVSYILPVFSSKYWFITDYVLLSLLSPWLNWISDKASKSFFRYLIIVLLFLYSIVPTFLYFSFTNDTGKGLWNMILLYLLGRYISLYKLNMENSIRKLVSGFLIILGTEYLLNVILYFCAGKQMRNIFAYDSSLFIITLAIIAFCIFQKVRCFPKWANKVSKYILEIYLVHSIVLEFIVKYWYSLFPVKSWLGGLIILGITLIVFVCSLIIAFFRNILIAKKEEHLCTLLESYILKGKMLLENYAS